MSSEWLDEVDEARRVTTAVGNYLDDAGVEVVTYWDDVSTIARRKPQTDLRFSQRGGRA